MKQTSVHGLRPQVYENGLSYFLAGLVQIDAGDGPVRLDFGKVEYWIPSAVAALCALANKWSAAGRPIELVNVEKCPARGYLQRIDFFDRIGFHLPENFQRHEPGTSFVEIQQILPGIARLQDNVASRLAACLAGTAETGNEVFRFAQYAVGEVIANCQQHAGRPGFVSAQYVASRDVARIGMADYGVGILEGFRANNSPDYRTDMTDQEALLLALQPWKSSKRHLKTGPYGESPNRGAGLTMIHHMIAESHGEMLIASGTAYVRIMGDSPPVASLLPHGVSFPGTLVSICFSHAQIDTFQELLKLAQQAMNLTPDPEDDIFG